MAIILQFVSDDFVIHQRLIRLQLLAKSLTGEEIARQLISVLQVEYGIGPATLVDSMYDRTSTNFMAMSTLKVLYPDIFDISCFSHTIDHVGERFCTPTINEFVTVLISLFSHSPKSHLAWQAHTGCNVKSYSKTRWSRYEVFDQLLNVFGDVQPFLEDNSHCGSSCSS